MYSRIVVTNSITYFLTKLIRTDKKSRKTILSEGFMTEILVRVRCRSFRESVCPIRSCCDFLTVWDSALGIHLLLAPCLLVLAAHDWVRGFGPLLSKEQFETKILISGGGYWWLLIVNHVPFSGISANTRTKTKAHKLHNSLSLKSLEIPNKMS